MPLIMALAVWLAGGLLVAQQSRSVQDKAQLSLSSHMQRSLRLLRCSASNWTFFFLRSLACCTGGSICCNAQSSQHLHLTVLLSAAHILLPRTRTGFQRFQLRPVHLLHDQRAHSSSSRTAQPRHEGSWSASFLLSSLCYHSPDVPAGVTKGFCEV
jgi:hypothetical protein